VTGLPVLAAEAWHIFGYGIGQAQIIMIGITTATTIIVGYRFTTRGDRYGRE
jgi:hypothetical protein